MPIYDETVIDVFVKEIHLGKHKCLKIILCAIFSTFDNRAVFVHYLYSFELINVIMQRKIFSFQDENQMFKLKFISVFGCIVFQMRNM